LSEIKEALKKIEAARKELNEFKKYFETLPIKERINNNTLFVSSLDFPIGEKEINANIDSYTYAVDVELDGEKVNSIADLKAKIERLNNELPFSHNDKEAEHKAVIKDVVYQKIQATQQFKNLKKIVDESILRKLGKIKGTQLINSFDIENYLNWNYTTKDIIASRSKWSVLNKLAWDMYDSAGVDVDSWTPEATIEDIEIFHPLIGVAAGFNVTTTSTRAIKLRKFGIIGSAAVVANHGVKPVIEMVGSQSIVNVTTIAGVIEDVADEDLEDNAGLQTEIQQEALDNLAQFENVSAIALLNDQAQAYSNVNFGTKAKADEKTALAAIIDQVRQALGNRTSDIALALNSSQWALLKDLRNDNGTPIDIQSVIGDVIQIVDNKLVGDNFIVFAKKFANIKIYKGKTAEWYRGIKVISAEGAVTAVYSEWRTDEQSVRVRQREVIYISDNSTVVKGTISGVVAALKAVPQP